MQRLCVAVCQMNAMHVPMRVVLLFVSKQSTCDNGVAGREPSLPVVYQLYPCTLCYCPLDDADDHLRPGVSPGPHAARGAACARRN